MACVSATGAMRVSKVGRIILVISDVASMCPCWAHIRRYFLEAKGGDQEFCSYVLRKIRYLYMLERVAKS